GRALPGPAGAVAVDLAVGGLAVMQLRGHPLLAVADDRGAGDGGSRLPDRLGVTRAGARRRACGRAAEEKEDARESDQRRTGGHGHLSSLWRDQRRTIARTSTRRPENGTRIDRRSVLDSAHESIVYPHSRFLAATLGSILRQRIPFYHNRLVKV